MTENARHEAPDVAELRRLLDATQRRLSSPRRAGKTYEMDRLRDAAVRALPALLGAATELTHMTEARDRARAEVERLAAAVRRVRELHRESRSSLSALYPNPICECGKDYPCPTIRAIGAES